jgi:hypothetical protein
VGGYPPLGGVVSLGVQSPIIGVSQGGSENERGGYPPLGGGSPWGSKVQLLGFPKGGCLKVPKWGQKGSKKGKNALK